MAEQLGISVHTILAGVRSIYRKLQARSVPEAVAEFMVASEGVKKLAMYNDSW